MAIILRVTSPKGKATLPRQVSPLIPRTSKATASSLAAGSAMPLVVASPASPIGWVELRTPAPKPTRKKGTTQPSTSPATMKSRSDPERIRNLAYLRFIGSKPCLICGGHSDAHHLTHAQPRAMSRKTGDQYTVPLCRTHHMKLHEAAMSERMWWSIHGINPIMWAEMSYEQWKQDNE